MRTSLTAAVLLMTLSVVSASAFGGPNLAGTMEAHRIVMGKESREIAVSAEKVYPQDKIEYVLRYRNVGDAPASGVSLVGPVPAGTLYLENSATESESMHPRYSIDGGKSFHEAPVTYVVTNDQGVEERRIAAPDMYTHVMWDVASVLEVGRAIKVSYRVQVK